MRTRPARTRREPDRAHIVPWAKVREHSFDNLIALCPTCHTRYDRDEIDQPAMRQYKANLGLLNSRYGDVERRVLTHFAMKPEVNEVYLPGASNLLVMYLVQDGYLVEAETYQSRATPDGFFEFDVPVLQRYDLTAAGREFVERWSRAAALV
ncbi:HNH endonuclease signature motif containing protein [Lentzea sp. NPDC058436]|uniref:HNH endonuclease signature motif containing protein n=1 Tax=Lentzea sp. NPDC058436 TaxID=3346499 RepID=UPI0036466102